jgi:hypothetical protein
MLVVTIVLTTSTRVMRRWLSCDNISLIFPSLLSPVSSGVARSRCVVSMSRSRLTISCVHAGRPRSRHRHPGTILLHCFCLCLRAHHLVPPFFLSPSSLHAFPAPVPLTIFLVWRSSSSPIPLADMQWEAAMDIRLHMRVIVPGNEVDLLSILPLNTP